MTDKVRNCQHTSTDKALRILTVFGTRPEAIKMAPVVAELSKETSIEHAVCVTAQHRQMLDQVLSLFSIRPEFDLDLMTPGQDLARLGGAILSGVSATIDHFRPDMVLVHGDTSTTLFASLAAFYKRIAVGHVEAGLRTGNIQSPWPEEANRRLTSQLSAIHFAPTMNAKENLIRESIQSNNIIVTGNTVIDALIHVKERLDSDSSLRSLCHELMPFLKDKHRVVLITGHRRENFGHGFERICEAINTLAYRYPDCQFVYPVHLNPNVKIPVERLLGHRENIVLLPPLDYLPFVYLMSRATFILTDSGGIQEEAPSLGKKVLVMRDTTERPEAIETGAALLVGTSADSIVAAASTILDAPVDAEHKDTFHNPFGDGCASRRIVTAIKQWQESRLAPA